MTIGITSSKTHISHVKREFYRATLKEASQQLKQLYLDLLTEEFNPPLLRPLDIVNITAHYSFDYAQQVITII